MAHYTASVSLISRHREMESHGMRSAGTAASYNEMLKSLYKMELESGASDSALGKQWVQYDQYNKNLENDSL